MNVTRMNTVTHLATVYSVQTVCSISEKIEVLTHTVPRNLCSVESVCLGECCAECIVINIQFYFLSCSISRGLCLALLGTYDSVNGYVSNGKQAITIILAAVNQSTYLSALLLLQDILHPSNTALDGRL